MDMKCVNCGEGFEGISRQAKYCGADCRTEVAEVQRERPAPKRQPMAVDNPVREYRCRKLGDAIPDGFIEAFMKGVAKHGYVMPKWSWAEIFWAASYESGRMKFPLSVPRGWPGGFEDLREITESPEFQAVLRKAELNLEYQISGGVPVVIFSRAKAG